MTDTEIKRKYIEINRHLADRKLKPAFDLLGIMMNDCGLQVFRDEWQNLEQTYHYMLQYTVEGIQDPERQKIYRKLLISAYELTDTVYESAMMKYSLYVEYEKKRNYQLNTSPNLKNYLAVIEDYYLHQELISLADEVDVKSGAQYISAEAHQQNMVSLFNHFWFKNELTDEENRFLDEFFISAFVATPYKSFLAVSYTHLRRRRLSLIHI